jgi:hypothetical protein
MVSGMNAPHPDAPNSNPAIDWSFIASLEGAGILKGYVPVPETSNSGVTIATGVDLGQVSARELDRWPIDPALKDRLRPYCGLRKFAAVAFCKAHPLTITKAEGEQIDGYVHSSHMQRIAALYESKSGVRFAELPDRAQTVIVSVGFQYGDLPSRCPNFWRLCLARNWSGVIAELRNFGDAYGPRRRMEADYLAPVVAG